MALALLFAISGLNKSRFLGPTPPLPMSLEKGFARIKTIIGTLVVNNACLHVGQMLFADNKYLLLKRITVRLVSKQ
jgi:hypothetical protein